MTDCSNGYDRDTAAALRYLIAVLTTKGVKFPHCPEDDELREIVGLLNDDELQELIKSSLDFHNRVATTGWGRNMAMILIEHARYHSGRLAGESAMRKKSVPKSGKTQKLSKAQIAQIVAMDKSGWKQVEIVKELGISRNTVGKYLRK